ncbi:hypothetical protein K456DRAFT_1405278 [Colletotrichum gloeosporioides 23]|nr:hypothetical protein K456DRAFT_1405278 [Colletotrichum gloeosporioides 23]
MTKQLHAVKCRVWVGKHPITIPLEPPTQTRLACPAVRLNESRLYPWANGSLPVYPLAQLAPSRVYGRGFVNTMTRSAPRDLDTPPCSLLGIFFFFLHSLSVEFLSIRRSRGRNRYCHSSLFPSQDPTAACRSAVRLRRPFAMNHLCLNVWTKETYAKLLVAGHTCVLEKIQRRCPSRPPTCWRAQTHTLTDTCLRCHLSTGLPKSRVIPRMIDARIVAVADLSSHILFAVSNIVRSSTDGNTLDRLQSAPRQGLAAHETNLRGGQTTTYTPSA